MVRLASLMRSAMSRRTPITLISVVPSAAGRAPNGGAGARAAGPGDGASAVSRADVSAETPPAVLAGSWPLAAIRSPLRMRPPGPDPATVDKSIPASRARRRLAGDAITQPERGGWPPLEAERPGAAA